MNVKSLSVVAADKVEFAFDPFGLVLVEFAFR